MDDPNKIDPALDEQTESLLATAVDVGTDFIPVVGEAKGIYDTYNSVSEGDYVGAGINAAATLLGVVPVVGDTAARALKTATSGIRKSPVNAQMSRAEYDATWKQFDEAETPEEWQKQVKSYVKNDRTVDPVVRTPELEESAKKLVDGDITRQEHLANIEQYKPVTAWDSLPREPSDKSLIFSLKPNQRADGNFVLDTSTAKSFGVSESALSKGDKFNGRLDIPAYKDYDTWIVAGTSKADKGTTYAKAVHYEGKDGKPVKFLASQKMGERIGQGIADKTGYATVSGWVKNLDADSIRKSAGELVDSPEWTQVGFDPRRQGAFYTRSGDNVGAAVKEADEVIQVGPLIYAKEAKIDPDYSGFSNGGFMTNYNRGGIVDKIDREEKVQAEASVEDKRVEQEVEDEMTSIINTPQQASGPDDELSTKVPEQEEEEILEGDPKRPAMISMFHGGLALPDNIIGFDPVSGNPIPVGSSPENVRDDIPAALSVGEYVVPNDVVRWHGLRTYMEMHEEAKMGLMMMQSIDQIKNAPGDGYDDYAEGCGDPNCPVCSMDMGCGQEDCETCGEDCQSDSQEMSKMVDYPEHTVVEEEYQMDEEPSEGVEEYATATVGQDTLTDQEVMMIFGNGRNLH